MTKKWFGTAALVSGLGTSAMVGLPERMPAEEALAPTRLEVDLSDREMYLYHNGELVKSYAVAVGELDYPTPKGDFTIDRIEWNPDWVPPNTDWGREREKKNPNDPDNPMVGAKLFFCGFSEICRGCSLNSGAPGGATLRRSWRLA